MGEFGWAYVKGALTSSGPTGSLQFRDDADSAGDAGLTGSAALVFLTGSAILSMFRERHGCLETSMF